MKQYLGIDQYGHHYHIEKYPRKELMEQLGCKHAEKMYIDRLENGKTTPLHMGYVIAGRWINVYKIIPIGLENNLKISVNKKDPVCYNEAMERKTAMVKEITSQEMEKVIETRKPLGKFLYQEEDGSWDACDNSNGDAWVETFNNREKAVKWLFEYD